MGNVNQGKRAKGTSMCIGRCEFVVASCQGGGKSEQMWKSGCGTQAHSNTARMVMV